MTKRKQSSTGQPSQAILPVRTELAIFRRPTTTVAPSSGRSVFSLKHLGLLIKPARPPRSSRVGKYKVPNPFIENLRSIGFGVGRADQWVPGQEMLGASDMWTRAVPFI